MSTRLLIQLPQWVQAGGPTPLKERIAERSTRDRLRQEFAARGADLDEGLAKEADALGELLPARQAQAAVYSFNVTQQRVKKQPGKPDAAARQVRRLAIVGSGLMGAQLGSLFLQRFEVPLVMKDIEKGVLEQARGHIEG
jgi:hypothetical protein